MANADKDNIEKLKIYLKKIPSGQIDNEDVISEIECLLGEVWHLLAGSSEHRMEAYKLGRMENVEWEPPVLTFLIERHGGMALGSVYAELQSWAVDIAQMTALSGAGGKRLKGKRQKPLDLKPIVSELARLIIEGKEDERLKWSEAKKRVRIMVGMVIPSAGTSKQTLTGRRKRFSNLFENELNKYGWKKIGRDYIYEKINS